jgi:hypothetical protein
VGRIDEGGGPNAGGREGDGEVWEEVAAEMRRRGVSADSEFEGGGYKSTAIYVDVLKNMVDRLTEKLTTASAQLGQALTKFALLYFPHQYLLERGAGGRTSRSCGEASARSRRLFGSASRSSSSSRKCDTPPPPTNPVCNGHFRLSTRCVSRWMTAACRCSIFFTICLLSYLTDSRPSC